MLKKWLHKTNKEDIFAIKFNSNLIQDFLDYSYFELKNSPRTYNNYLTSLTTFSSYLLDRGYINQNPCDVIKKKKNNPKIRSIISPEHLQIIKQHFTHHLPEYNVLIAMILYCLIRRTELTRLKVKDIRLHDKLIIIPSDVSKNRKRGQVTIPKNIFHLLTNHIIDSNQNDYIFSKNLKPGPEILKPQKITDIWTDMRNELQLPKSYQF